MTFNWGSAGSLQQSGFRENPTNVFDLCSLLSTWQYFQDEQTLQLYVRCRRQNWGGRGARAPPAFQRRGHRGALNLPCKDSAGYRCGYVCVHTYTYGHRTSGAGTKYACVRCLCLTDTHTHTHRPNYCNPPAHAHCGLTTVYIDISSHT